MEDRRWLPTGIFLAALALSGCGATAAPVDPPPTPCPISTPTTARPAETFRLGDRWFSSPDGGLWLAQGGPWQAGGNKVMWVKPTGATMTIRGQRLDGEAPPAHADIPEGYTDSLQATGLFFPTAGCWEVTAQAAQSTLRLVITVEPAPAAERPDDRPCTDLADAVARSPGVIIGQLIDSTPGPHGTVWQSVAVRAVWKNPYRGRFDRITLLQDGPDEPRLAPGRLYLIFLQPGLFRATCPAQTLATVDGGEVHPLGNGAPLWHERDQMALRREVVGMVESP